MGSMRRIFCIKYLLTSVGNSGEVSVGESPWVRLFTDLVSRGQTEGIQATVDQIKEPGVCESLSPQVSLDDHTKEPFVLQ